LEEEFLSLKKKIERAENKLQKDKKRLQEICLHKNLIYESGHIDYQGYDRDYIPGHAHCKDCGLYVLEDNRELYEKLRKIYYENSLRKQL
jgi:formylmethanofuran dehydrogenase subunit E